MTEESKGLSDILSQMQKDLKAPKSQYNSFAKFHYRNCEDILEAVKKVMPEGVAVTLEDKVVRLGDRFYVKSIATIWVGNDRLECAAYAREALDKKGMDPAQITGAASSYARKYALNGLFLIDDSKDVDSRDNKDEPKVLSRTDHEEEFFSLVEKLKVGDEILNIWKDKEGAETICDISTEYLLQLISAMRNRLAEKK